MICDTQDTHTQQANTREQSENISRYNRYEKTTKYTSVFDCVCVCVSVSVSKVKKLKLYMPCDESHPQLFIYRQY